jgi:hypothetical protein
LASSGNAPAEVHLAPGDAAALAEATQLGEDLLDEFLSFLLHVSEGGEDKHSDFTLARLVEGRHDRKSILTGNQARLS